MLDINRLRVFRAVVAAGSVNRAAVALGYTPSAVSQHLAGLQRQTGLRLVERSGRGLRITATGRLFATEAGAVLERSAALDAVVADLRAGRVGSLAVSYFTTVGVAWIPPVVAAVTREFPDLRLELWHNESPGERRAEPDVDVFVEGLQGVDLAGYAVQRVLEEPYLVVLPATHPLAACSTVPLTALAEEPWVDNELPHGPCRQVLLDACSTVGFRPSFRVETHDYRTAVAFVAAGLGVTVLPRLAIEGRPPPGLAVRPVVDPAPTRRIAIRVRESTAGSPAVDRFVGLLREQAAQATQSRDPSDY